MITDGEREVLDRATRLLSGQIPIEEADTVFDPRVVKHMDDYRSIGVEGWQRWFRFLVEKGGVDDLGVSCDRMEKNPDGSITLYGRWQGTRHGEPVTAEDLSVRYRIEGDRIVELWTHRVNYVFFFGPIIRSRPGLWLVYVWMRLWHLLAGRRAPAESRVEGPAG